MLGSGRSLLAKVGASMALSVPAGLAANCLQTESRREWLARLPDTLGVLSERWLLTAGEPFDSDCGLVLRVTLADGTPAVLKLVMPHMEGHDEVRGMLFWNGDPTARVLQADLDLNAMLLERCDLGTSLRAEPQSAQDIVIADLLRRLWRITPPHHGFRPLVAMMQYWTDETVADAGS
jgi:streptomycin 6-kinase